MKTPADRLLEARRDAGYDSVADVCRAFGWSYPTYAGHENGSRGITAAAAEKYSKAFNVSLEWLLTGKAPTESAEIVDIFSRILDPAKRAQAKDYLKYLAERD